MKNQQMRVTKVTTLIVAVSMSLTQVYAAGFDGSSRTTVVAETQKVLLPATGVLQAAAALKLEGTTRIELQDRTQSLKDSRKQQEKVTEAIIQEKLESSRLEDERKRAQKLFGNSLASDSSAQKTQEVQPLETLDLKPTATIAAPIAKEETPVESSLDINIKKQMTVTPEQKNVDIEALKEEIRNEVKAELGSLGTTSAKADNDTTDLSLGKKSGYVGALIGSADYPDLYNVESDISAGFVVGGRIAPKVYMEGSFLYSRHYLNQDYWNTLIGYWERINQYNIQMAAKYAFIESRLMPTIGGVLSYTRRTYSSPDPMGQFDDNGSSTAFDVGLVAGLDFALSSNFSIGADFRYMINLTASEESEFLSRQYRASGMRSIEESNYYVVGGSIKLLF